LFIISILDDYGGIERGYKLEAGRLTGPGAVLKDGTMPINV